MEHTKEYLLHTSKYAYLNRVMMSVVIPAFNKNEYIVTWDTENLKDENCVFVRPSRGYIEPLGILVTYLKQTGYNSNPLVSMKKYSFSIQLAKLMSEGNRLLVDQNASNFITHSANRLNSHYSNFDGVHAVVKNALKAASKELGPRGKFLFLGRDAWWFAVIAEQLGYPYYYNSSFSRGVSGSEQAAEIIHGVAKEGDIFYDTGFMGSVWTNLLAGVADKYGVSEARKYGNWVTVKLLSHHTRNPEVQSFSSFALSRNYALALEYLPKLNKTGRMQTDPKPAIVQETHDRIQIISFALATMAFYLNKSPKFIENNLAT